MTDEQLAELAAMGDKEAFTGLYERYKRALFNFAWRLLGEAGLAEDAAQEAMISAFRHIRHFDPAKGSFKAWIFTIAHNESRHCFRMRKRWSYGERSGDEALWNMPSAPDCGPSQDGRLDLERALMRLPVKYRLPLILSKLQGLSLRECAEVLQLTEANVKQRVFRAMRRLRESLSPGDTANRK